MSDEKRYLTELETYLGECAQHIKSLVDAADDDKANTEVHEALQSAVDKEGELRENCEIGVRFNVVNTQLQAAVEKFDKAVGIGEEKGEEAAKAEAGLAEDETLVYVYLFNAHGMALRTWQNLLLPSAFFEHSVNRPIYADKEHVEAVLRAKPNKDRHAYVEVVIKKDDIFQTTGGQDLQDKYGHPLLRLRQGALKPKNAQYFFHKDTKYKISKDGQIV